MTVWRRPPGRMPRGTGGSRIPMRDGRGLVIFIAFLLLQGGPFLRAESLTEEQAVERGLSASQDLAYESALLSAKELTYSLGIRQYFPRISLGYDENATVATSSPDSRGKTISVSATQPLLRGGTKPWERSIQHLDLRLAREDLEQKYRALSYTVSGMFSAILMGEQKRAIIVRTIALAQQNIDILRTQVRLGGALELDLAQAELERLTLEISLADAETSLEDSRYQMKKLLSLDPAEPLDLRGAPEVREAAVDLAGLEEALYAVAAGCSPDLKRQDASVRKASIEAQAAVYPFIPDIDLELSAAFTGEQFPLRVPQYSGKLTFSFAVPEAPTTYTGGASTTPGRDRGGTLSVKTSPFENISAWIDRRTAVLSLEAESRKREQVAQDLRFQVTRMMSAYAQASRAIELSLKKVNAQRRKEMILSKQVDLGEVKRIDFLLGAIETASAEIALSQAMLDLREREREWEALLGLPSGGLRALVERERSAGR
jgi:outer membrane protein TolC